VIRRSGQISAVVENRASHGGGNLWRGSLARVVGEELCIAETTVCEIVHSTAMPHRIWHCICTSSGITCQVTYSTNSIGIFFTGSSVAEPVKTHKCNKYMYSAWADPVEPAKSPTGNIMAPKAHAFKATEAPRVTERAQGYGRTCRWSLEGHD
jgi:hypothetical protein